MCSDLGVYRGYRKTFQRVKPAPPTPASLYLTAMARSASLKTADQTVDYFVLRFLRVPLSVGDRAALVEFLMKQWGGVHAPVVFSGPNRFVREASEAERETLSRLGRDNPKMGNESLTFLRNIATTADQSSDFVRTACAEYRTKMDYGYGPVGVDLKRISALIKAGSPTRLFYLNFGSFDTHGSQAGAHSGLFNQLGDAVMAFLRDMKALGRENDVAVMAFTEFGRRVKENASFGTDHGVASPMFVIGKSVKGGFYGKPVSLTDLDDGILKMTTDFRCGYATMIREWMGYDDTKTVLKGDYPTLGVFA